MKVKELIELLRKQGPDAEVQMVIQPTYPHAHRVAGVASDTAVAETEWDEDGDDEDEVPRDAKDVVYILQGDWVAYGPRAAWRAAHRR
jgi:hypothetical protein